MYVLAKVQLCFTLLLDMNREILVREEDIDADVLSYILPSNNIIFDFVGMYKEEEHAMGIKYK